MMTNRDPNRGSRGRTALHLLTMAGAGLAQACADVPAEPEPFDPDFEARFAEVRDHAAREVGDQTVYNIEWDLWFATEDALRDYLRSGERMVHKLAVTEQLSTGEHPTFALSDAVDIRYCVSDQYEQAFVPPGDKQRVVDEVAAATAAWQRVARLRFVYLPEHDDDCNEFNAEVDFAVVPERGGVNAFCGSNKLGLPSWGCPLDGLELWGSVFFGEGEPQPMHQGLLVTSYESFPVPTLPDVTTVGILKHELGHILGMRHEHLWADLAEGVPEICHADQITVPAADVTASRLTPYDEASVMRYPHCAGIPDGDLEISSLDGAGMRMIYTQPAAWYVPLI